MSIRDKYGTWTKAKLKQLETEMEWVADEVEEAYRMDAEAIEEAWDTVERLLDTDKEVLIEINGVIYKPDMKDDVEVTDDNHIPSIISSIQTSLSNYALAHRTLAELCAQSHIESPDGRFSWNFEHDNKKNVLECTFTTSYLELENKNIILTIENTAISEPTKFENIISLLFNYEYQDEDELNNLIENHLMSNELKKCFKKYQHEIGEFTIKMLEKNRWILKTPKEKYILAHDYSPVKETNVLMVGVNKLEAKVYVKLHKIGEYFDKLELVFV